MSNSTSQSSEKHSKVYSRQVNSESRKGDFKSVGKLCDLLFALTSSAWQRVVLKTLTRIPVMGP